MVGHPGNAPGISCSQGRRITFFLVPEETCARDRTCTGFLVCERDATRLLRLRGLEKWRTRRVLPLLAPARQAGKHAVGTRVRNWRKTEGMLPRPSPARSVFKTVPARLSGSSSKIGCPRWIRTIIGGFRVRCPTVGRQGRISGEPGGSCNLTNVRLKVGCRSAVASGS